MVWFQCEACGENLKKPKLLNHFRMCSAFKLSCIDCGETFNQQSVQGHTQCITEMEKYGPKGQGKALGGGVTAKPNKDGMQRPDIDIHVGLSDRPPWFCSLCNTKATSSQTLLSHADGKKHRAKARAFHAANQPPKQDESAMDTKLPTENTLENDSAKEQKLNINHEADDSVIPSKKKQKLEARQNNVAAENSRDDSSGKVGNGEVIQIEKAVISKFTKEDDKKKIQWKKLIASALESNPDGVLKMRKLRKHVLKNLRESGVTDDETSLIETLEQKINLSSKFAIDNKCVRLAAKQGKRNK